MGKVQTTQATSKSWKAIQGLGCLTAVVGIVVFFAGLAMVDPASKDTRGNMAAVAMLMILIGPMVSLFGRLGAWWFHG